MTTIKIPHSFFQQLGDAALLSLKILGQDSSGVTVEVDEATAQAWKRQIPRN